MVASKWRKEPLRRRVHHTSLSPLSPWIAFTVFALSFLLVFAPLGMYFVNEAASFFARAGVSVFSVRHDEPVVIVLGKNALRQLAMFGSSL